MKHNAKFAPASQARLMQSAIDVSLQADTSRTAVVFDVQDVILQPFLKGLHTVRDQQLECVSLAWPNSSSSSTASQPGQVTFGKLLSINGLACRCTPR